MSIICCHFWSAAVDVPIGKRKVIKRGKTTMAPSTNPKQYEVLIEFLEQHEWLAKGKKSPNNLEARDMWAEVAVKLNAFGPPCRDGTAWRMIWRDFKYGIRQKLIKEKSEISKTGGGRAKEYSFSNIENAVIALLSLQEAISGIQNTPSFDSPAAEKNDSNIFETQVWRQMKLTK